ncbi:TetR family transcriptional regulator [Vibrio sp. JC009]|uniref:TetR family transcriptional regulator n=1 Tax=Vibrio sp. JC009 TaxID=2912314 RepID=UPI0023AEBC9C|nr:TetR family transcriptional regulator [Vibrio sp. JC009]WED24335.1 TetR family transcriptional regulator [Vibrio sp. JC009]
MPKRSKEDTEITIQTIMDAVADQLIRLGYDKMSYTTLSEQTGISRTGISHHFPKKTDFIGALDGRIFDKFVTHLELESGIEAFSDSWLKSLSNDEFIAILRILFHHISCSEGSDAFAKKGTERLYELVTQRYGEDKHKELEWLMGKAICSMGLAS